MFFFEGSYTDFPSSWWYNQNYASIFNNNQHYLGSYKSIDYAYTKVNSVQKVLAIGMNGYFYSVDHYHSDIAKTNANVLWFGAYNSIIHGAKGIWFWDLNSSFSPPSDPISTGVDRFELAKFPLAYRNYIRFLSRELRYLVNKDILSTVDATVVATKTDVVDPNNIILNWNPAPNNDAEHTTNNPGKYDLRYTIRTNGQEALMIITNPMASTVTASLNFLNYNIDMIRNTINYNILFETTFPNSTIVNDATYKTVRSSNITLDPDPENNTVGNIYTSSFNGIISNIAFGPLDVHIIRFGPFYNQWYDETRDKSSNLLQLNSEIKCSASGSNIYYVRNDGILHVIYPVNGIWTTNWLNSRAPKVLRGTGLGIDVSSNDLYYVSSTNKKVHRMFYSGSSWQFEQIDNSTNNVRSDSRIIYSQGNLFYVREDGIIHIIYRNNGVWATSWLNASAKPVKRGIGMTVAPDWNCPIYYQGNDGLIYNITWNNSWNVSTIYNSTVDIRTNSELCYGNGQIFYVRSDGIIHVLHKDATQKWVTNWLNGNAPKVKAGTNFALSTIGGMNTIYYIAEDNFIYQFAWTSQNGWQASKISPTIFVKGRDNVDVYYMDGNIYYGGSDTKVHALYFKNNKIKKRKLQNTSMENSDSTNEQDLVQKVNYEKINVYPNPASSELNIEYQLSSSSNIKISLYNIFDQKIKQIFEGEMDKGNYLQKVNISNLNSGVYVVKILTNSNIFISQKVIIQK